jgi:Ca2+-binding RTX toxin-like protein
MIDGVAPMVTTIASANANGTYGPGALITLTARFSEAVTVNLSGGVPSLLLETGVVDRVASYVAGSGSDTLLFAYTVQNGDVAGDLDLVANNPLALNGATLQDAAGNPANLSLPAPGSPGSLAANAALVISGVTPQSLTISTATAVIEEGATLSVAIRGETLAPGATTYWRFSGNRITPDDFSPAGLSGSIALGSDRRAAFSRSIALDALTEGNEELTLEFFADAGRSQSLGRALFTIRDLVPVTVSGATDGRDLLIGTAADEIISGVPTVSALHGRGSYDTLTGNAGRDLFLLGNAATVFYDDGNSSTPGSSDLAAITDFAAGDRLQLHGSAADYRLASGRVGGASGVMLYRLATSSGSSPAGSDELIGFLRGLTPASLILTDPNQISYV